MGFVIDSICVMNDVKVLILGLDSLENETNCSSISAVSHSMLKVHIFLEITDWFHDPNLSKEFDHIVQLIAYEENVHF